jgi:tetratricopeptide (TPR) repeat protein
MFRDEGLELQYRMDENQALAVKVVHGTGKSSQTLEMSVENPLTHVVNPHSTRIRIDETEEELRTSDLPRAEVLKKIESLAQDYGEIGQKEKALDYYIHVLRNRERADPVLLNSMAILCGELSDHDREEKFYREAASVSRGGASLFNLALSQRRRGQVEKAIASVDGAIDRERDPPYLVLRAQLADRMDDASGREQHLAEALATFDTPSALNDWELGWLCAGLRMKGDREALERAEKEWARRPGSHSTPTDPSGILPDRALRLDTREG